MSQLDSHPRGQLRLVTDESQRLPEPGDMVSHRQAQAGSLGTVVASDEWDATVLWTHEPLFPIMTGSSGMNFLECSYVFSPYVPLQVTPTLLASGSVFGPGGTR